MQNTIKRTKADKVAIGEVILFMAMLGVYLRPETGERLERVDLAHYLAGDQRRVARWWDLSWPDEKLYFVQQIAPPAGWDNRVAERWKDMKPEAQDNFARQIQQACIRTINELRKFEAEAVESGLQQAREMAGGAA